MLIWCLTTITDSLTGLFLEDFHYNDNCLCWTAASVVYNNINNNKYYCQLSFSIRIHYRFIIYDSTHSLCIGVSRQGRYHLNWSCAHLQLATTAKYPWLCEFFLQKWYIRGQLQLVNTFILVFVHTWIFCFILTEPEVICNQSGL